MEIERKYLLARLPEGLDRYPRHEIEQGYLCSRPTLRIRRIDDQFVLTVKERVVTDSSAIVNREEEFAMSADSYRQLREKCDGRLLTKTRYKIPLAQMHPDGHYGQWVAELDRFHGRHEGLSLVEVEFRIIDEANSFVPPDWFGQEVSNDPHYRNSYLASNEL